MNEKNLTSYDIQKRIEIDEEIDQSAKLDAKEDFSKQRAEFEDITEEEYIQTKLATVKKELEKSVASKIAAKLLSDKAKISISTLEKYAKEAGYYHRANENQLASQIFFLSICPKKSSIFI